MSGSGLIDQFGVAIPPAAIARLREEISPVDAMRARPPFEGHLAFGIDPGRLGAIIRAADAGNTLEYNILASEVEELFPHYAAVLAKRRRQVIQQPITVKPAADHGAYPTHSAMVMEWVETGVLQQALFDVTDAIGRGYSVSEIIWDSQPGRVAPAQILFREARHFEISWKDGETIWLRTETGFEDLPRHKFLVHRHKSKSGLVARSGTTRLIIWLWLYASYTLKDWALFVQGYGLPTRVGKYGPAASDTDKRVLWRAVSSIAGDVAAIIPNSMEIEFVKSGEMSAGGMLYEKRLDWFNREVSKIVLGSTAGTEAISGGHAVGQEHREAEKDVVRFDCALLGWNITRQIVQAMVAFTFGPQDRYPVLQLGQPDQIPLEDFIAGVADMAALGLRVKTDEVRERLGLTKPEAGDETLGTQAPIQLPPNPAVAPPGEPRPGSPKAEMGQWAAARGRWLGGLLARHSAASPDLVEQLTARVANDAAGALAGMTDRVRAGLEEADRQHGLVARLSALHLPTHEFAEAMARGMALAELVGEAALIDELGARTSRHAQLDAGERDDLGDADFAVPGKRALPIHDATHVRLAWDMVDRTHGLTTAERRGARRRILARAKRLRIDTSTWKAEP